MRVIALALFSAICALAQWQTQVSINVFSLGDQDYRNVLLATKAKAERDKDHVKAAKVAYMLSRNDPDGYKEFTEAVTARLTLWKNEEISRGEKCSFHNRIIGMAFAPYGMNPVPGDVQMHIRLSFKGTNGHVVLEMPDTFKITDGVELAVRRIQLMITMPIESPKALPTSLKKSI